MGTGLPPVAEAAPESSDRQVLKCYEEGRVLYCEPDRLEELIAQAGTTPTRIEIGNGTETLLTKTIVIPAGADIELVDADISPWSSESKIIRDDGDFTGSLLKVEKGAKLTLSDGTGNGAGITIDSRAQYENVVKGSSFSPTILVEGELVMNAGTVTGARKLSGFYQGAVTAQGEGSKFTMNGGKITDNHRMKNEPGSVQRGAGNVALTDGATMVMNGGEISKGETDTSAGAYGEVGGIGVFNGAHLEINGGKVTQNTGWVGNINVFSWIWNCPARDEDTTSRRATFEFNDGEISEGDASFGGGGINIFGNADVTMNGGTIENNHASNGGGVNAMDLFVWGAAGTWQEVAGDGFRCTQAEYGEPNTEAWTKLSPGGFTMNGGSIIGNSASRTGGGVNVVSNGVHLNAGTIEGNTATQQGGGIYVATQSYTAHFKDALITENSATDGGLVAVGGGVWLCPTGSLLIHVTNGVAIFDNQSPTTATDHHWGDDIAHDAYGGSTSARMLIDSRMLGGGEPTFYKDGGYNQPRFDAENPGKKQVFDGKERESDETSDYRTSLHNAGLKTIIDQDAKDRAKSWARLIITKNQSPRGGGIGSNGGVEFGTPEKTEVKVSKAWKDAEGKDLDEASKVAVKVQLVGSVGNERFNVGQPAELNADNKWTHTFKDLPKTKTVDGQQVEVQYSVEELSIEGFTSTVSGNAKDGFTITNVQNPPTETVEVKVSKVWKDAEGKDLDEASKVAVKVQLVGSVGNERFNVGQPAELNADNEWTYTFKDLPKTKAVDGQQVEVQYSVEELSIEGFTSTVSGDAKDGFTITNVQNPPTDTPPEPTPPTPPTPEKPRKPMPRTGAEIGSTIALALGLLGAGVLVLRRNRA
ncbi:Cna B-type domain-containing protein [Schaalia turicensis]|uniref:Cna B-type domain-containing protein n=1 Tax=Schaalia turicensis TaxID=131111 RepID=UPI0034A36481